MNSNRRKFIGTAVAAAAGIGLAKPFSLLAEDNGSVASQASESAAASNSVWRAGTGILKTPWTDQVTPEKVWPEYPRPQLSREKWLNLNGLWDYQVTAKERTNLPDRYAGKILVPFGFESPLSGVMKPLQPDQRLWYQRDVVIPEEWAGQTVLLHFGAVDWEATIYIDGRKLGSHRGGYDSFSFDITRHIKAGNRHKITVSVWDPTDTEWQLHGKQTLHPGGCSYTATSGIWQTVWLEPVPESHIEKLEMLPDLDKGILKLTITARTTPKPMKIRAVAKDNGQSVAEVTGGIGQELTPAIQNNLVKFFKATSAQVSAELEVAIPNFKTWSPDKPFLYDLNVDLQDADGNRVDSVTSYFGMRSIKAGLDANGHTRMLLNGQPILMPGALDQGFWPDGVYLAPTDEALRFDIEWAKKLGLNTVRKHVKIEPERWYYWADKLGLMVFQDMPTGNCGDPKTDFPTSPEAADQWRTEVAHIIENNINHPSIVSWAMFNEAFGGFDYLRNAAWARQLDPSRLINESSGFPWHGGGEVRDSHSGVPAKEMGGVFLISEDGTPSIGVSGHQWPHAWTYHSYDPKTGQEMDFLAYYNKHRDTAVLPTITPEASAWLTQKVSAMFAEHLRNARESGLSGDFYCQLVDVETECDGLMSYDRVVPKVDAQKIAKAIQAAMPKIVTK